METTNAIDLRQALSQFATGVTIVTAPGDGGEPIGITANSFNSVSLEPPMILWSLAEQARSRCAFEAAAHFCVHVLAAEQRALSERFACQGADKFRGLDWSRGMGGVPLLTDYVARFQCRTAGRYPVGDHIVFVGEVLEFRKNNRRPLVFLGGRYAMAERRFMADGAPRCDDRRPFPADRRERTDEDGAA